MRLEHLENVKRILAEALDLTPAERPGFLARACADNLSLKREVESLLAHEHGTQPWLEGPIFGHPTGNGTSPEPRQASLEPGQRIGPYRIIRLLGEGGMGTVALATREDDFEKRVALKVIRSGLASEELIHRFHNERQILAQLDHPAIARLLDGGTTTDGHPFYVMEYVEGLPIDEYCARHELTVRQRLELFLEVCSALQLAHRNLIVHRDLKPHNILVTSGGKPKLLDFGIAKRLDTEATALTGLLRPMTVKYASPEQIDNQPVTTGTDVYALGVLLYELLTGEHPYASSSRDTLELARAIREDPPKAPSTAVRDRTGLRKRLAGDLDSIVLKAMRKEPNQRYGSVEGLAEDVRRYLEGREVAARKGSRMYRAGKFVRRNRRALAVAAAFFLIVTAFGATTTVLWRQAVSEHELAELARQRRTDALGFMGELLVVGTDPNRRDAGAEELTAREILERGEKEIEKKDDDPLLQAEVLASIGEAYVRLGMQDRARAPWERAEYLLRPLYPQGHPLLARVINNVAGSNYYAGRYDEAEKLYVEALEMKRRFPEDDDVDLVKSMVNLALIYMNRGEYEDAEPLYLQALDLRRESQEPDDEEIARSLRSLGVLYYTWGFPDKAEPYLVESLEIRERIYQPGSTNVATALATLGRLRQLQKRHPEAEELFTRALEIREKQFDPKHLHVASSQLDLARLYLDTGELARGEPLLEQALGALREKTGTGSWEVAEAESVLGGYRLRQGRFDESETLLKRSYRTLTEIRGERSIYARSAERRLRELEEAGGRNARAIAEGAGPE